MILLLGILIFNGCGKEANQNPQTSAESQPLLLAINGDYSDSYNSSHSINNTTWTVSFNNSTSTYEILEFNNEEQKIVALNGDDSFSPGTYSVFEWVIIEDSLYYCQSVYDAETREEAENAEKSDSLDPSSGGCGTYGFPWTELL